MVNFRKGDNDVSTIHAETPFYHEKGPGRYPASYYTWLILMPSDKSLQFNVYVFFHTHCKLM